MGFGELLVGERMEIRGEWCALGEVMEAPSPFRILCPMHLFHLAGPVLCPFIVIQ